MIDTLLRLITAIAFLGYGVSCLASKQMVLEFERFGVPRYRCLVGITQIIASVTLFVAPWAPVLGRIGAGGLTVQMLAGSWVRFRIGDTLLQASQALVFCGITGYLSIRFGMTL